VCPKIFAYFSCFLYELFGIPPSFYKKEIDHMNAAFKMNTIAAWEEAHFQS